MDTPCQEKTNHDNNGRDQKGRFAKGNAGGPGNPFARQVGQLRKVLLDCLTEDEMTLIAWKLIDLAKAGDLQAARLLFSYTLGKPGAAVEPDQLDLEEGRVFQETAQMQPNLLKTVTVPDPLFALEIVRNLRPAMARDMGRKLGEMIQQAKQQAAEAAPDAPSTNGHDGEKDGAESDNNMLKQDLAARAAEIAASLRAGGIILRDEPLPPPIGDEPLPPPIGDDLDLSLPRPSANGRRHAATCATPSPNGAATNVGTLPSTNGESGAGQGSPSPNGEKMAASLLARLLPFMDRG